MNRPISTILRRPTAAVLPLAVAIIVTSLLGAAAQQRDDFFESALDGNWVGSIQTFDAHILMQLNLNAAGADSIGFVVLQDDLVGAPTATQVFVANVSRQSGNDVTFSIDDQNPVSRAAQSIFKLDYAAATDSLDGSVSGGVQGSVRLARLDPDLPLQKLWSGTAKIDGKNEFLLLLLTELEDGAGRLAASSLGGQAWIGSRQGAVNGERNGSKLQATVSLPNGDMQLSLTLKKKNRKLQGTGRQNGTTVKMKLSPAAGDGKGKPVKFKSAAPATAPAGTVTTVTIAGSNFAPGAVVHSDVAGVAITSVQHASARQLRVTVTPSAGLTDGTAVGLRVLNSDGQTLDRSSAFTVTSDGGDDGPTVSFESDVQPIFNNNCAITGCHATVGAKAGLVLEAASSYSNLVGVSSSQQPALQRINAGDAEASYLVRKIRGGPGISGARMPFNRAPLTDAQINTIVTWANEGAPSNRIRQ